MVRVMSRYVMTVYADVDGEIDPARLGTLLADAAQLGGSPPVEYVAPQDGDPWGLRVEIYEEAEEEEGPRLPAATQDRLIGDILREVRAAAHERGIYDGHWRDVVETVARHHKVVPL